MRRLIGIGLPALVLLAALMATAWLIQTRPRVEAKPPEETVWPVETVAVRPASHRPEILLFGEIVASREAELRALVAGQVVETSPALLEGAAVKADALVVAIDPFEYRATLEERRAQLVEARARTAEIEARRKAEVDALAWDRRQLELNERDANRKTELFGKGTGTEKALDDARLAMMRQRVVVEGRANAVTALVAQLDQQRAAIERMAVGVRRAERDLENTRLTAPFDGILREIQVAVGKRLAIGDRVAILADPAGYEARVFLPDADYGRLTAAGDALEGRSAKLVWRTGELTEAVSAEIARIGPRISAGTGGVNLYARLAAGPASQRLRPGAFVELRLPDRKYDAAVRLPAAALYAGGTVYVVAEGRLQARAVELLARDGEHVLVKGALAEGERALVTRLTRIGPGLRVREPAT